MVESANALVHEQSGDWTGKQTKISIDAARKKGPISRHIYGHFAEHLGRCIYEGIWVGRGLAHPQHRRHPQRRAGGAAPDPHAGPALAGRLFRRRVPLEGRRRRRRESARDGQQPLGRRRRRQHFGTHEFLRLCELLGCEPYICGNVGSGTVQEMQEWVEYMTSDGDQPMADLRGPQRAPRALAGQLLRRGQRELGLRRQMRPEYYADVVSPLPDVSSATSATTTSVQDRLRRQPRRLSVDRGADA